MDCDLAQNITVSRSRRTSKTSFIEIFSPVFQWKANKNNGPNHIKAGFWIDAEVFPAGAWQFHVHNNILTQV